MKPTNHLSSLSAPDLNEPVATPLAVEMAQRIRALANTSSDLNDRLGGMFGEGNAERMAVPVAAGIFGEINAAISDLEMFMERVSAFVARIY